MNEKNDSDNSRIPVFVLDQHHRAYKIIRQSVDKEKLLPKTGNTIIHLDAHIDELVPKNIQILEQLESNLTVSKLFNKIGTETWLKTAVEDNCIKHVIWVKPPWAIQVDDTNIELDNDATLDVKTLGRSVFENVEEDYEGFEILFSKYLKPGDKYILDMEYNFLSADNPFTADYAKAQSYYFYLKEVFELPMPLDISNLSFASEKRKEQLLNLQNIFNYLEQNRQMPPEESYPSDLFQKVSKFRDYLLRFYPDDGIEWRSIYNAGIVSNEHQLPVHHTSEEDIKRMLECVGKMLDVLPSPPTLITVAIMYEYDRFTPKDTCEFINEALNDFFNTRYENVEFEYEDY